MLLEVYFWYISYCQKDAIFEDQYDQIKELLNCKNSLGFHVITEQAIAACSRIKRNILKNLKFLSFGILMNQFYNEVYDLLRLKLPNLSYRNTELQLATYLFLSSMNDNNR